MKDYIHTRIEQLIKRRATLTKLLILVYLIALTISNMVGRVFVMLASILHRSFDRRQAQRYHEIGEPERRRINLAIFTPYIIMTWFSASVTLLVSYQLAMRGASMAAVTFLSVWLACWFVITWRGIKYKSAY
jgi:hypothetical protein